MSTSSQSGSTQKIPLFYVIVLSFIVLTVLATGLVGYLSFQNGQLAVNDVASQLRGEITTRIKEEVYVFLNTPNQINQGNANILQNGIIAADNAAALEHYFWEQIHIFNSVSSINFGNTEGGLANAGREGADGSLYVIATDGYVSGPFKKYATNDEGERTDLLVTVPDFDARTRLWYIGAVEKGGAAWSDVYIVFTGHDMAISASRPVYDESQQLLGVVSVDLFLTHLSDFLGNLDIGETGEAFIVERSGMLVASSSGEKLFTEPDEDGLRQRLYAHESATPLIRHAAEALTEQSGGYDHMQEAQRLEFEIDGVRQFMQVSPIENEDGLDWLVIVVIPEADFMAQINAHSRTTFLLILVTLAIAMIISIIITQKITHPILQASKFSQAVAKGEWGEPIGSDSHIGEISILTESLNHMAARLEQMVAALKLEVSERKQVEENLLLSRTYYQMLFNESPAPLWEEEFSDLYVYLDELRQHGVVDFRAYFEQYPDEVVVCTQKVKIVEVNRATLELYEAKNKEDLLDNLAQTFTEQSFAVFREELIAIAMGQLEFESEAEVQTLTGELRNTFLRLVISKDQTESFRALLSTTDITAHKRAEEEQLKLKKLESLGVLAGGIAHDFNNLLTGLYGNLELAKLFLPADHKSHKYLDFARESMQRATNLTKQLLTFARGGEPVKKTLPIDALIIETAQFSLRGSNVSLLTHIASALWLVDADKGQISQVITNLVINAQQAMPMGGVVTITAENAEMTDGRYVKIMVQDEGVGIAAQYLDKIFDPYFSTKQKGNGLGLASTHSIISKHNGRLTVDSRLNEGTTFTIYLPAAVESEGAVAEELVELNSVSLSSLHVLVMDDDDVVREVVGSMLEQMGHAVSHAADGEEAIAKYKMAYENEEMYDLVITDLTIPGGMGGQELARAILKINPQAKIIVSSGYATDPVMANYEAYGFSGIIAKPYQFSDVQESLQQVIDG